MAVTGYYLPASTVHPRTRSTSKIYWTCEFEDADKGKDGQMSWEDWKAMLFHELMQAPAWIDGSLCVSVSLCVCGMV